MVIVRRCYQEVSERIDGGREGAREGGSMSVLTEVVEWNWDENRN